MSGRPDPFAPERYELSEAGAYRFDFDRRGFLKGAGTGLAVVLLSRPVEALQESGRQGQLNRVLPEDVSAWLHIDSLGQVTVFTGKVEVGQNIRTSLSQVVADELRSPMGTITMVMGDTDRTPYDRGTFGSRSIPTMARQLRRAAAVARRTLVSMAAERWGVEIETLEADRGHVVQRDGGKSVGYGELTGGEPIVKTLAETVAVTEPAAWSLAGRSHTKVNGRDFVTGSHRYTSDLAIDGMLHGKVLRPPRWGATLKKVDTSTARQMRGVRVVEDGTFVGVAAESVRQAEKALASIEADWVTSPQPSSDEIFDYLKVNSTPATGRRGGPYTSGDIAEGLAAAAHRLEARFTVDYIAHTPLEPRAALAVWRDGKLTAWTGTQRPFGVRTELAGAFRLSEASVRVLVPDTGSGYGGKHTGEAAVEAARLAKGAARPVKLVWTREEEFNWAYFRPAGVIEIRSGIDSSGKLLAWEFHNYNSGSSSIRPLYDIPHQHIQYHRVDSPLRQGSYRALASTANHFAREVHVDELAAAAGRDPLAFRLDNLGNPRLEAVLTAAAEAFGWGRRRARPRHGFGLGGGFEKGGYTAACAEVVVDSNGQVSVERVVQAFECGAIVNPGQLRNQIEGSIVQGLGGALFEQVRFEDGINLNPRLSDYRVPRFSDLPDIEVVLVNRTDLPSAGGGETPIIAVAPAVCNAIYQAAGKRLRSLPMAPDGIGT